MRPAQIVAGAMLAGLSQAASAHGTMQGLSPFFSGAFHPLFEPPQWITLLALGLMIGQREPADTRVLGLSFFTALCLGLAAAAFGTGVSSADGLMVPAGLIGAVVLTAVHLPRWLVAGLAALAGLGIGVASEPESLGGYARAMTLLGTAVGVCAGLINIVGLVRAARREWMRIGVRVVGSWITAAAVLVLTLWAVGVERPPSTVSADQRHVLPTR